MSEFRKARDVLAGLEAAKEDLPEVRNRTKEWRQRERKRVLDRAVPDRRCPRCKQVKLRSRQWVILRHVQIEALKRLDSEWSAEARRKGVLCKGCKMSLGL